MTDLLFALISQDFFNINRDTWPPKLPFWGLFINLCIFCTHFVCHVKPNSIIKDWCLQVDGYVRREVALLLTYFAYCALMQVEKEEQAAQEAKQAPREDTATTTYVGDWNAPELSAPAEDVSRNNDIDKKNNDWIIDLENLCHWQKICIFCKRLYEIYWKFCPCILAWLAVWNSWWPQAKWLDYNCPTTSSKCLILSSL